MKELAEWLIHIERLAGNLYGPAADAFREDQQLHVFLKHLSEEEAGHERVMLNALDYIKKNYGIPATIALDQGTKERVETPFSDCRKKLELRALKREHIINCVATAEFSEWNDIFMYVIKTLKEAGREFEYTASQMQAHKNHIEEFIATYPEGRAFLETLRRLPPVWNTQILVVEDHAGVREFMRDVLSSEASVDTAVNGREGLEKVRSKHYDVIISDVDMPVMNGMEFYRETSREDPRVAGRFLFLTGFPSDEALHFFDTYHVRYLTKPMRISEIKETVSSIRDSHSHALLGRA
jgi:CheY-like chemotaxis protein